VVKYAVDKGHTIWWRYRAKKGIEVRGDQPRSQTIAFLGLNLKCMGGKVLIGVCWIHKISGRGLELAEREGKECNGGSQKQEGVQTPTVLTVKLHLYKTLRK
jgi:hypothetical protein